jgi:hypothetical protein
MPNEKRPAVDFPLELDADIHVVGFTDNRDIQIRLPKGAFIHASVFSHAMKHGRPGETLDRGRVVIRVLRTKDMEVKIELPSGKPVTHRFDKELCDEIAERVSQIETALHTYEPDPAAMERAEKRRLESRGRRAKAA